MIEADLPGCTSSPARRSSGPRRPTKFRASLKPNCKRILQYRTLAITATVDPTTTGKACPFDHLHQKSRKTDGAD